ncbi:MAG: hypothetical protein QXO40_00055 [Candidatus Aenigmatarchaeota archaeon]
MPKKEKTQVPVVMQELSDDLKKQLYFSKLPIITTIRQGIMQIKGETETFQSFNGVVIYISPRRVLWEGNSIRCFSINGEKPSPYSLEPKSEKCTKCSFLIPKKEKNGVRCMFVIKTYWLLENSILPAILTITKINQVNFRRYLGILTSKGKLVSQVITKVQSREDKNKMGFSYCRLDFSYVDDIDERIKGLIPFYVDLVKRYEKGTIMEEAFEEEAFEEEPLEEINLDEPEKTEENT